MHVIKKQGAAEYYLAAHFKKFSIATAGSAFNVVGTHCDDDVVVLGSFDSVEAADAALAYIVSQVADGGVTIVIIIDDL